MSSRSHQAALQKRLAAYARGDVGADELMELEAILDHDSELHELMATFSQQPDQLIDDIRRAVPSQQYADEPSLQHMLSKIESISVDQLHDQMDAADEPEPSNGKTVIQNIRDYRLIDKLGSGGMGAVYKALHSKLQKTVAIKILPSDCLKDPESIARFDREMIAVGQLNHPNIVSATDGGEFESTHFLVMEYVEGTDLAKLTRAHGPLPVADACEIVRQAAVGLAHAHDSHLVHCDIKPSNLMLTPAGRVKILDLGLARVCSGHSGTTADREEYIAGTPDYMAPEQGTNGGDVDPRTDIYALGCTLYKLLTGRAPFANSRIHDYFDKVSAHLERPLPPIRERRADIPAELSKIIERMLAKDPNDRYQTAVELASTMQPFARGARLAELAHPGGSATEPDATSDWSIPKRIAGRIPTWWRKSIAGLVVTVLVVALSGPLIYRLTAAEGTLLVAISDDSVETVAKGKELTIHDTTNDRTYKLRITQRENKMPLKAGSYTIAVTDDSGLSLNTDRFSLMRGDEYRVQVTLKDNVARPKDAPETRSTGSTKRNAEGMQYIPLEEVQRLSDLDERWTRFDEYLTANVRDIATKGTVLLDLPIQTNAFTFGLRMKAKWTHAIFARIDGQAYMYSRGHWLDAGKKSLICDGDGRHDVEGTVDSEDSWNELKMTLSGDTLSYYYNGKLAGTSRVPPVSGSTHHVILGFGSHKTQVWVKDFTLDSN